MANPEDTDAALIAACVAGDREPFAARFGPLVSWVVRQAASSRGQRPDQALAEDLRQEAFLALFQDDCRLLKQFRPGCGCRPASWVGLIARQAVLKALEKAAVPRGSPLPAGLEDARPAPEAGGREEVSLLRQALSELPPREAFCLKLLVERRLPPQEVASILGVSRQTIYPIKERALAKLRTALGKSGNRP